MLDKYNQLRKAYDVKPMKIPLANSYSFQKINEKCDCTCHSGILINLKSINQNERIQKQNTISKSCSSVNPEDEFQFEKASQQNMTQQKIDKPQIQKLPQLAQNSGHIRKLQLGSVFSQTGKMMLSNTLESQIDVLRQNYNRRQGLHEEHKQLQNPSVINGLKLKTIQSSAIPTKHITNTVSSAQYYQNTLQQVGKQISRLDEKIDQKFEIMDQKFDILTGAVLEINERLKGVESRVAKLEARQEDAYQMDVKDGLKVFNSEKQQQQLIHHINDPVPEKIQNISTHKKLQKRTGTRSVQLQGINLLTSIQQISSYHHPDQRNANNIQSPFHQQNDLDLIAFSNNMSSMQLGHQKSHKVDQNSIFVDQSKMGQSLFQSSNDRESDKSNYLGAPQVNTPQSQIQGTRPPLIKNTKARKLTQ
eukprot:403333239